MPAYQSQITPACRRRYKFENPANQARPKLRSYITKLSNILLLSLRVKEGSEWPFNA